MVVTLALILAFSPAEKEQRGRSGPALVLAFDALQEGRPELSRNQELTVTGGSAFNERV